MLEKLLSLDLGKGRSGQPKYERLKEYIIDEMLAGRLKPGEALPSEPQLAQALGVAKMTIRQAMDSLESDGLIRRIQGKGTFVEDDARRRLKRGQDIFALVVPEARGGFYSSLLEGCEMAATGIHHQMLFCNSDENVGQQANIILHLVDKEIGGVAIMPPSHEATPECQIRQLQKNGIPVVFCHRRVDGIIAPLLATPYVEVGRLAGQALISKGHKNIAYFATEPSMVTQKYEQGLHQALRAEGIESLPEITCVSSATAAIEEKEVFNILKQTFARPDPPTAIFASFDILAEMIYLLMPQLGLRIPEDVSLIGYGGAWREGAIMKRLTSVVLDQVATGKQAVNLLHEMRTGKRPIEENSEIVLEVSLYEGETVEKPREKERLSITPKA